MNRAIMVLVCLIAQATQAAEPNAGNLPARKFADVLSEFTKAPEFQSTAANLRSIELNFETTDLVLQPQLGLTAKRFNEHREFVSPVYKTLADTMVATLTKPFSTGTTLRVIPSYENALSPARTPSENANFNWEVSISQSLWRDSFGHATRLRWARESFEKRQQIASALQTQAETAVKFETVYWDWANALRERELRLKNVTRGREILKWIRGRLARSAAEASDVLQAEAMLANEELQLATVEQSIRTAQSNMSRYVPIVNFQPDVAELSRPRDVNSLVTRWNLDDLSRVERLELVSARNAAMAAEKRADETRDGIRPDLELQLGYGKNAIDPNGNKALSQSFSENHEQSTVAVVFSTGLDLGLEYKKVEAARAARESAKFKRQALESEAHTAWSQVERNIKDMQERVQRATELASLQVKKANAERQRYRMGRTTAFQAISYEQDAVNAEIALTSLNASARKQEAQARLFAR
ncbi:MAG: TolC family protein [Bdellovibrionales bacterium]|nr:TolC family protein [Bdellovibrionales bacterium]